MMPTLNFNPFPEILTERLRLRQLKQSDLAAFQSLRSDPVVMKYLDRDPTDTVEKAQALLDKIFDWEKKGDAVCWVLSLKDDSTLFGTIGYHTITKAHFRAEIGYMIHPSHHQKGYAHEAIKAVLDYGFQQMHLHSIEAVVSPNNQASIALLKKNNFIKEAHYKENYYYNGEFLDSAVYSILKQNFLGK